MCGLCCTSSFDILFMYYSFCIYKLLLLETTVQSPIYFELLVGLSSYMFLLFSEGNEVDIAYAIRCKFFCRLCEALSEGAKAGTLCCNSTI